MKENKGSPSVHTHVRRHSWPTLRNTSRKRRWLKITLIAALIVVSLQATRKYLIARSALMLKYTPTTFPRIHPEAKAALEAETWRWEEAAEPSTTPLPSFERGDFMNHRLDWRRLGRGFEGETFRYSSNVAKVFRKTNAPFRNCVPGASPELRWPTEIPASLILGGRANSSGGWTGGEHAPVSKDATFLPVTDYFISPGAEGEEAHWHFLTPFLPLGGLEKLAKRLRNEDAPRTPSQLDVIFRPSLERLLRSLNEMHTTHELCHDDIKLDNVFLASPHGGGPDAPQTNDTTHWMLGDLGNVRELDHPYHTSLLWLEGGRNLPDCRSTDVLRLLKVYMTFFRESVRDKASFDKELFRGAEPWSALFWSVRNAAWGLDGDKNSVSAISALEMSQLKYLPGDRPDMSEGIGPHFPELNSPLYQLLGESRTLSIATGRLLSIATSEYRARWWALAPILGIPSSPCEAATASW